MAPPSRPDQPQPQHPLRGSYKSIGEMLTDDLRKTILSGGVEEGEYLRQRSLARRYGVSEVVVREALRLLEAEGLVETERHKGARVSRLSAAEVMELWELRIQLEKLLTHHAVPAFQAEDLARTEAVIQAMSRERDPVAWLALNREFHDRLYRPSGRLRILRFANNQRNLIDRYLRMRLGVLQHYEIAHREHRSILAAYRQGNALLAVKRVEAHLQRTADSVVAFLTARKK
jgi:DNA-binding GntR family transcriptional regulator